MVARSIEQNTSGVCGVVLRAPRRSAPRYRCDVSYPLWSLRPELALPRGVPLRRRSFRHLQRLAVVCIAAACRNEAGGRVKDCGDVDYCTPCAH